MTQLECAKNNIITPLMKKIAKFEEVNPQALCQRIKEGKVVIFNNKNHEIKKQCAVGEGLSTKINANIGTSTECARIDYELKKLKVAVKYGCDTVMDLSIGGNLQKIRKEIIWHSPVPVGTVPIYEAAVNSQRKYGSFLKMKRDDIFSALESQAKDGVDFFTIHAGMNRKSFDLLKKTKRLLKIVSRGGAILAAWMEYNKNENPLYEFFDRVIEIAYKYDIVLSLGDALRPGSIADATDRPQIEELQILGKLCVHAKKNNVQVIIEGPGHVPLNQIRQNIRLEKNICKQAPFYVLGPLVTDVSAGYDHITAAIGGAVAAAEGADFLCYVTPAEHLRLPTVNDVREGVIAAKIAGHAADLAKGKTRALKWDKQISFARKRRDWKKQISLSIDPFKARKYRRFSLAETSDFCTMCGKYCSIKLIENCLRA